MVWEAEVREFMKDDVSVDLRWGTNKASIEPECPPTTAAPPSGPRRPKSNACWDQPVRLPVGGHKGLGLLHENPIKPAIEGLSRPKCPGLRRPRFGDCHSDTVVGRMGQLTAKLIRECARKKDTLASKEDPPRRRLIRNGGGKRPFRGAC